MAKRPEPQTDYRGHEGYPSANAEGLDRRAFLRRALASSATVAGALTLSRSVSAAPAKRLRVSVDLTHHRHLIGGTRMRAQRLIVFTKDKKLARFLRVRNNTRVVSKEIQARVKKTTAKTLTDGRKLYRLERDLARAVARVYRLKTKRVISPPDVMLQITRWRRRYRMLGGVGAFP